MAAQVHLKNISFTHEAATEPLFNGLNASFPKGFTGIVGANGAGKTTLLRLVAGLLVPDDGNIEGAGQAIYCEQRTDLPPANLEAFLEDWDAEAYVHRGSLGIEVDFLARWDTLSHGERKRAQIGCALWAAPTVLAIDEPTNHIDSEARKLLIDALQRFAGTGLIVSHDRELLDTLCSQCLWLDPPDTQLFTGGISAAREQRDQGNRSAQQARHKAVQQRDQLAKEFISRQEKATRSKHVSKRGISAKDHDAKGKIDLFKVSGQDGKAGRLKSQMQGRLAQAEARLASTTVKKEYEVGIWLPGSRSRRDHVLQLAATTIPLGDNRELEIPDLLIKPTDRVAITGSNGRGKSTLLRYLLPSVNVPMQHLVELPQEISARRSKEILHAVTNLNKAELGQVMTIVSRLGSRPDRLLRSREPSPGEVRKLLLALGMTRLPHLIVMDEPTNHLDLPSIEALQTALADCPCAMLLVSHDRPFLDALSSSYWHIEQTDEGNSRLRITD